mmetsp:Transcript_20571/g.30138  ORF Transcript_20571/g.30138 Transcript_20571/m.30138 type:complete len:330 (+) Transcript_20571:270-1259(+)|eukprot:CAMPEP_0197235012 /NCGR_PEP_ID=MMETSP1429-20130617/2566_1 /TAXON_ID=49237 /ORGANISM="Chaetoceros  sp., Strain UNC1202" /LENGTH=329 /DNA_ID=CAMNT_0042693521 /DNA_START=231 /DNA_END=1220 /DNA_ORIENTATION=-
MTNIVGPFGIDPLYFNLCMFGSLILFVLYLLLPRGIRVHYFYAYPKRYTWSARPRRRRVPGGGASAGATSASSVASTTGNQSLGSASNFGFFGRRQTVQPILGTQSLAASSYTNRRSDGGGLSGTMEETVDFDNGGGVGGSGPGMMDSATGLGNSANGNRVQSVTSINSDEAIVSNATAQLRSQGVVIVAHGSRGKPKTVRLQLTNDSITWRTETRRKNSSGQNKEIKLGKLHSVALSNIMYVDVGKQTTALRRQENVSVPESLCFSLLTKEGSLDLEANSPRERDALVGSFSLVLDDVHAQNWRDIYRASNDMPSSFDEYDEEAAGLR